MSDLLSGRTDDDISQEASQILAHTSRARDDIGLARELDTVAWSGFTPLKTAGLITAGDSDLDRTHRMRGAEEYAYRLFLDGKSMASIYKAPHTVAAHAWELMAPTPSQSTLASTRVQRIISSEYDVETHTKPDSDLAPKVYRRLWVFLSIFVMCWGVVAGAALFAGVGVSPLVAIFGALASIVLIMTLFTAGKASGLKLRR